MTVVGIFSADYCQADDVSRAVADALGLRSVHDQVLNRAGERHGVPPAKLLRAMRGPPFLFDRHTHKRDRYVAYIREALAEMLVDSDLLVHGFAMHLIPATLTHVLRVCLLADQDDRVSNLVSERRTAPKEALKTIREADEVCHSWTTYLLGVPAWEKSLYDLKIPLTPTNPASLEEAAGMIIQSARLPVLEATEASRAALDDFQCAARAGALLVEDGFFHRVDVAGGEILVTIDEHIMRLDRLEERIRGALAPVAEGRKIRVETGAHYRPASVFAPLDIEELPRKVLLVDDEHDFVVTLSERLQMRDIDSAVAASGNEALDLIEEDVPDVMVLDLNMPGIDGVEVLRRVKANHPLVEVIILTGHGDEKLREVCLGLGAFAYLEKPVDIEVLSRTMKEAHARIREQGSPEA